MAQRRMFNKAVTNNDNFLEMPASSQNLYFHLSMNADDDGFIDNWKSIIRMIGAKEDDLKILITKQFILPFESGVIVIRHWRLNNYLQKDRLNPTIYQEELSKLSIEKDNVYAMYTSCIHSIDKNSIDKNSIDKYIGNSNELSKTKSKKDEIKEKVSKKSDEVKEKKDSAKDDNIKEIKDKKEKLKDKAQKSKAKKEKSKE